jgi:peptide/nickel transport system permease protein
MNSFIIGYFALLIGASCVAAYYTHRTAFLLLFSLTLASFIVGLIGGEAALWRITVAAGIIAGAAGIAFSFREFLTITLPRNIAKEIKNAPLTATFGLFMILIYMIAAVFAPIIAPFGQAEIVSSAFAPADETMLLGGDQLGRDMFSRLIYGARNTVGLALVTTILAFVGGTSLGLLAATKGGFIDQVLSRTVDVFMSIPSLIFSLLLLSIFGTNIVVLTLVIAFLYIPPVFRLARAVAGNIVVMDYIEAAKLRGEGSWHLIWREILPNASAPLIAEFGLRFCFVFLLISGLSFLGLGLQPPTADWGSMVRENSTLISFGEIVPLIPAGAIALLTVSVNFVVDWMLYRSSGLKK